MHESKEMTLPSGEIIEVDVGMARVIMTLAKAGYRTSGSCIGDEEAWVIIQEVDEGRIVDLMAAMKDCEYNIGKELFFQNGILYTQYILNTPLEQEGNKKRQTLRNWCTAIESGVKPQSVGYDTIENLWSSYKRV